MMPALRSNLSAVMPAHPGPAFGRPEHKLVVGIPLRRARRVPKRDGRDKPGHDDVQFRPTAESYFFR